MQVQDKTYGDKTSPGSVFQCLTTPVKRFFLISILNLSCCRLRQLSPCSCINAGFTPMSCCCWYKLANVRSLFFFNCFYWLCSTPRQREIFLTQFPFQYAFKVVLKVERHATHPETHSTLADYFFNTCRQLKSHLKMLQLDV